MDKIILVRGLSLNSVLLSIQDIYTKLIVKIIESYNIVTIVRLSLLLFALRILNSILMNIKNYI